MLNIKNNSHHKEIHAHSNTHTKNHRRIKHDTDRFSNRANGKEEVLFAIYSNYISESGVYSGISFFTNFRFYFVYQGKIQYFSSIDEIKNFKLVDPFEPFEKIEGQYIITTSQHPSQYFEFKCRSINEVELVLNEIL